MADKQKTSLKPPFFFKKDFLPLCPSVIPANAAIGANDAVAGNGRVVVFVQDIADSTVCAGAARVARNFFIA